MTVCKQMNIGKYKKEKKVHQLIHKVDMPLNK